MSIRFCFYYKVAGKSKVERVLALCDHFLRVDGRKQHLTKEEAPWSLLSLQELARLLELDNATVEALGFRVGVGGREDKPV